MDATPKLVFQKQQNNYTLTRGTKPCDCPFQPAIPLPTQVGSISITRMSCNSDCALMQIKFNDQKKDALLTLHCAKDLQLVNVPVVEKDAPVLKLQ